MHLVDQLVAGVGEGAHCLGVGEAGRGVLCGRPGPGAGVGVAFGCDVLGGRAGGADAVDGGLVELDDEVLVHVVEFVVRVEDDAGVGGEGFGEVGPEGFECGGVGDDGVVIAAVYGGLVGIGMRYEGERTVVGGDEGGGALVGDVLDLGGQVAQVGLVEGCVEFALGHALELEVETEGVHAAGDEGLKEVVSICNRGRLM